MGNPGLRLPRLATPLVLLLGPAFFLCAARAQSEPDRASYQSPYVFSPGVLGADVRGDFAIPPRAPGNSRNWSHTKFEKWEDFHFIRNVLRSSWGPYFQNFGDPGEVLKRSREWQMRRLAAAGNELRGIYPYAHHHMHVWKVPDAEPWISARYNIGQGIDCSDFTNWMYNYGLGITLKTGIREQAELTTVPLYASFGSRESRPLEVQRVCDIQAGYTKDYEQLCRDLRPGDLLFIRSDPELSLPISHVIMWLGEMARDTNGRHAHLVFDSHGAVVRDSNGVLIPSGPQIRPFVKERGRQGYYYGCFDHALRVRLGAS